MNKIYLIGVLMILFTSCKTNRNLIYMSEVSDKENIEGIGVRVSPYLLKSGDNLFIEIKNANSEVISMFNQAESNDTSTINSQLYVKPSESKYSGYLIDRNGEIFIPVIGIVKMAGLSMDEAIGKLQAKFDIYIKESVVSIKLLNYQITVLGEVNSPGLYYNENSRITVLEAIAMAKGNTQDANMSKVLVVRKNEKGSKTYRLDLTGKNFMKSEGYLLNPGDVVYIQPDKYKNLKTNTGFYSLLLSSISTIILVLNVIK